MRPSGTGTAPAVAGLPRLASDVRVHAPVEPGAPWIVQRGPDGYIRAGSDMADLLRAVDGTKDSAGLAGALGRPWTAGSVSGALERLAALELLDGGARRPSRPRRVRFVPPLTLQFAMLRPERVVARLVPVVRLLATRPARLCSAAVAAAGLLALLVQAPDLGAALGRPLPLRMLLLVLLASTVTRVLHETGHGAVLACYGGRPSRMGVMLFYLTPAFFCDVSDGWRLPHRHQRVRVALAGSAVQVAVAACTSIAAAVVGASGGSRDVRDALLLLTVGTVLAAALNLLPFAKFDGYIALMSHLDVPHLRERAMVDGRRAVARALFGGRYARELPQFRWAPAFGVACLLLPVYLVGVAATVWLGLLRGTGFAGAVVVVSALLLLLNRLVVGFRRLAREARAVGVPRRRIAVAVLPVAVLVSVVAGTVTVPWTVVGGFVRDAGGTRLVLADMRDADAVDVGARVTLVRRGLIARTEIGAAIVGEGSTSGSSVPLSALVPVLDETQPHVPALVRPLIVTGGPGADVGAAEVLVGSRPIAEWFFLTYIAPIRP